MRTKDVVVLGSVNLDLTQQVPVLPRPGQTVLEGVTSRSPGGKGANQAVAAKRASGVFSDAAPAAVALVARVGDDAAGTGMLTSFGREGLDIQNVWVTTGSATGLAVILVEPGGQNCIAVASGANAELAPGDVEGVGDVLADAAVLLLQMETPAATVAAAVRAAGPQTRVVLNYAPAPDPAGPGPGPQLDLARVDVLVVNETEAAGLSGRSEATVLRDPLGAAQALQKLGPAAVVVTLGAAGGVVIEAQGACHRFGGHRVPAVDATGAGDTFCGVLAVALAEGADLSEASALANTAAALAVQSLGAQPGMPHAAAIRGFEAPTLDPLEPGGQAPGR